MTPWCARAREEEIRRAAKIEGENVLEVIFFVSRGGGSSIGCRRAGFLKEVSRVFI